VIDGEHVMQLIMTSGTTARPKAVMRTHVNCLWSAHRFAMQARLTPSDRNLTALPGFHVNCLDQTLFSSLVAGATVILLDRYRATRYMEQVRRHRATVISLVPMLIRTILAQPPSTADREHCVRLAIGGLQLTREELDTFERRFGLPVPILGGYGLTEASTNVTLTVLAGDPRWPSIGLPAIDRMVMLVDDDGRPVPVGETGEVIVQGVPGRSLMKGYWRDPEATASSLRDGWLYTGDLARRDSDGYFYFVDRKKDMIKVSGENVAALEVERVVLDHPAVADAAVVGAPDPLRDEAVKAYVVLEPGCELDLETLRLHCEPQLARFKIPTLLTVLDELPRATIGKVDKGALRARARSECDD
jgi:carnitine-CoA ligase